MLKSRDTLYIGTGRTVLALDAKTGEERWRAKLKSVSGSIVTLLLKDNHLYVGHGGWVYCLSTDDGAIIWKNGLPKTGYYAVMLAMEGAEGNSVSAAAAAAKAAVDYQQRG